MSLDDLKKQVAGMGDKTFNDNRAGMMAEGRAHEEVLSQRDHDREAMEHSHTRLHKEALTGKIENLKKDIVDARASGADRTFIREQEKQLHKLQNDRSHLQGEILQQKGMGSRASNTRYHNPHYF